LPFFASPTLNKIFILFNFARQGTGDQIKNNSKDKGSPADHKTTDTKTKTNEAS